MSDGQLRIFVVGDAYMSAEVFTRALQRFGDRVAVRTMQFHDNSFVPAVSESEKRLHEYAGDPHVIARGLGDADVLLVHGAIVSDEVLDAGDLRLVCCARGGPVNVDVEAATRRGIPVVNTPGKNAEAVAELTIGFVLSLFRNVSRSSAALRAKGRMPESTFDGIEFLGRELPGTTIGLIGVGNVGRLVAARAQALGMTVIAHDPFVTESPVPGMDMVGLPALLGAADVVSLHARATEQNFHLLGADEFAQMKPGAYLINTARESLVDEDALLAAVRSGAIRGAAMDMMNEVPAGQRHPFLDEPNILVTPHIGGATTETLDRGAHMICDAIEAMLDGRPLPHVVNPSVFAK